MRHSPNSDQAKSARRSQLADAWTVDGRSRAEFVVDCCRNKHVLDIGCVNHSGRAMDSPEWLHRRIVDVAASCLGMDYELEGIARMRDAGLAAVAADVTQPPPAAVLDDAPFDLVVAGELIEHLGAPQALLDFAREVLKPGGQLLLTTPNPFALWRARAGQLRLTWESVDHVTYLFPSGIAEMASRAGLELRLCTTVDHRAPRIIARAAFRSPVMASLRRFRGRGSTEPIGRLGLRLPTTYLSPMEWALHRTRRAFGQLGETSIYVLERPRAGVTFL